MDFANFFLINKISFSIVLFTVLDDLITFDYMS